MFMSQAKPILDIAPVEKERLVDHLSESRAVPQHVLAESLTAADDLLPRWQTDAGDLAVYAQAVTTTRNLLDQVLASLHERVSRQRAQNQFGFNPLPPLFPDPQQQDLVPDVQADFWPCSNWVEPVPAAPIQHDYDSSMDMSCATAAAIISSMRCDPDQDWQAPYELGCDERDPDCGIEIVKMMDFMQME
jgi:hypothetical protein